MNSNRQSHSYPNPSRTLAQRCLASCQKLIAQIEQTKDSLVAEFRQTLHEQDHLLRLALNEAEALAWQTDYPHLVFPTLAAEKVQALGTWVAKQRSLRHTDAVLAFAA
jgi:hypothetical protein